jgi:Zn-finger nucleic acid-binding protein
MQCPACRDAVLIISERQNIEIDYCPQCRGVWLDRGELDKLIERSPTQAPAAPAAHARAQERRSDPAPDSRHDRREHSSHDGYRRKKREGFLSDLFDF